MTDEVVWEDPPRPGGSGPNRKGIWDERLAPLRDQPGQWAKVMTGDRSQCGAAAHNLNHGKVKLTDADHFEIVSRKLPDGSGAVYARYIGPAVKAVG